MLASKNNNNQKMLTTDGIPLKKKLSKALFRSRLRAFGLVTPLLLLISIGFVFLMIVVVMFSYIASAERGERLGVPGFEGTLIFLCLLQAPTILFRKNPDLLDG